MKPAGAPAATSSLPEVLFVSYPAGLGGSARSLLTVLDGLEGRCRRIVACRPDTTMAHHLAAVTDETVDLAPRAQGRLGRVADTVRLARWARRHRRRLFAIHANGLSELKVAVVAASLARTRLVVWVHEPEIPAGTRRIAPVLRTLAPATDWLTVSEASREALVASGVSGHAAVHVVPNPISTADLGAPDAAPPSSSLEADTGSGHDTVPEADTVAIAYLGAPAVYKGFELVPDVIEAVASRVPAARWHIWSGPQSAEPQVWARLRALEDRGVELHDKTLSVADAYLSADIVFCPSLEESFGRVAAEAMAFGRPVVASDLPALREVLGDAGVFFPRGDHAAAADALVDLLPDAGRRSDLAARGLQRAVAYEPSAITAALADRYGLPAPERAAPMRALVVSHEATRTGAPVVAAQVANALRAGGAHVEVVLRATGPLEDEFGRSADAVLRERGARSRAALRGLAQRTRSAPVDGFANRYDEWLAGRMLDRIPCDLVWCNTVLSASYLRPALARGRAVVLHVHELGRLIPGALRRYQLTNPTTIDGVVLVAASGESQRELAAAFGLDEDQVELLESTIDVDAVARTGATARAHRAGDASEIVIGACGHATERKGTDLWLEIAERVHAERPATRFVWVGRDGDRYATTRPAQTLGRAVHFTGESSTPIDEMAAFDIFTLPSRHDTFPLVVLEAMALGQPIVAFDAGGAARQLGAAGVLVAPGDLDAFAAALVELVDDPARRSELGTRARARVAESFDLAAFGPRVRGIAERARALARPGTTDP
jgi:glycosyltransferase involved in cell wall biosynthesis